MIDLVAAIACIAVLTGLPEAAPPDVCIGERPGAMCGWHREWPGAVGLYNPAAIRGVIWVAEGYEHMIPLELVHHLQSRAGRIMRSAAAEAQAVRVQVEFWTACPEAGEPWPTH